MTPHKRSRENSEYPNTIALCTLFVGLGVLGFYLSNWQWSRGIEKKTLQSQRQQLVRFKLAEPAVFFFIEQSDGQIQKYQLALSDKGLVAIKDNQENLINGEGYWHPLERNIFQPSEPQERSPDTCHAYNLWSCRDVSREEVLSGVISDKPWASVMTPERHWAYAWQWVGLGLASFGMALALSQNLILRLTHVFFNTRSTA